MPGYDDKNQVCTMEEVPPQNQCYAPPRDLQPRGNSAVLDELNSRLDEVDPNSSQGIEICSRIAELPVAEQLGLEHWWIKTPNIEAGMGPADGGVPGVDGDRGDLPYSATQVTDHTGQAANENSTCVPAAEWNPDWDNVDRDCVEQLSTVGTPTGPWTPLLNDCHDWVENTMNECDPDVQEQQAEELRRSDRLMQQILDDPTLW